MKTIKVYFYNGFNKPVLMANTIDEIKNIHIYGNYLGDVSNELLGEIDYYKNDLEGLTESLAYYDLYINPTLKQLQEVNRSYGLDKNEYLADFASKVK